MSQFGGQSQYGIAQFGGTPVALSVGYCIDRMLAGLADMKVSAGGAVRTVDILSTDPATAVATLPQICHAGLPAILIGYVGGTYAPSTTNTLCLAHTMRFVAIVAADTLQGRNGRLDGRNWYAPGLWQLMDWTAFKAARALNKLSGARTGIVASDTFVAYEENVFVGQLEFTATRNVDLYDAAITTKLERIGIVHTPSDLNQLFDLDNVTPNTDDPTSPGPGVAQL